VLVAPDGVTLISNLVKIDKLFSKLAKERTDTHTHPQYTDVTRRLSLLKICS